MGSPPQIRIRSGTEADLDVILSLIKGLAEYERLAHQVIATADDLQKALFGPQPSAEVLLACVDGKEVGFALYFHNFSTFTCRKGLYLEDLFVVPEFRGRGIGKSLLVRLARIAVERGCGRFEWAVLDWNESAIGFYKQLDAIAQNEWTVYRLTGDSLAKLAETPDV